MKVVALGLQWGDEGKGKVVDFLSDSADIVVRFAGGNNAGHRISRGGKVFSFHLVPSGLLHSHTSVVLGSCMVINPESLFVELDSIKNMGIEIAGRVAISNRAHVVFPEYLQQDKRQESERNNPIGTTGKGIGVAYMHKATRTGVRFADIYNDAYVSTFNDESQEFILEFRDRLRPLLVDMPCHMQNAIDANKNILFEGAQGIMLDIDLGTYPYVTSSNTELSGVCSGAHVSPREIDKIIGVCKAYSTRVGNGPFPTEYESEELLEKVRTIGHEFGVTTGRPRRCGYLDLVALRYAVMCSGVTSLALTHLDVFDGFDEIQVCTSYSINGTETHHVPASLQEISSAKPNLVTLPGWEESISDITDRKRLPKEAQGYIEYIESFLDVSIDLISVGPKDHQTIVHTSVW